MSEKRNDQSGFHQFTADFFDPEALMREIKEHEKKGKETGTAVQDKETVHHYIPPRTLTEKIIAEMWSEILGLQQISIDADFFELGGYSLIGVQLMSRMCETFKIQIPMKEIFSGAATIAEFAKVVEKFRIMEMDLDTIDSVLQRINQLSDEEVKQLLAEEEKNAA